MGLFGFWKRKHEAKETGEKSAEEWSNEGITLAKLGRYEEAIRCFDKALEINQKLAVAWFNKGRTLSELGMYEEEIQCYMKH